ncbi:MAG: MBL fold metallo-hydrolase [Deltaproteobacteria bacterium]|nr:MBL fold metallo-hydrolase [Deltaproteobacteria bacterium]
MVIDLQDGQKTFRRPKLIFLGTGAAWRTPELGCSCGICMEMRRRGESRGRTALWFDGVAQILIDCGPDITHQLEATHRDKPDLVLLTHEHGDHYLGLDELEVFRRRRPAEGFVRIPVYAHPDSWETITVRFNYLMQSLLEKRLSLPGEPLAGLEFHDLSITPFKTDHGPAPRGSVGYILEYTADGRRKRMAYTSDFKDIPDQRLLAAGVDVLVAPAQWFNEPDINRPNHMSLQRLIDFVAAWRPREHVYLVHISDGDSLPDEPVDAYMKKRPSADPLRHPITGRIFPTPKNQEEWQAMATAVFQAFGLSVPVTPAYDGLEVEI